MVRRVEGTTEGMGQSVWHRDIFGDEAKGTSHLVGAGTSDMSVEPWGISGQAGVGVWGDHEWRHLSMAVHHALANGLFIVLGSSDP